MSVIICSKKTQDIFSKISDNHNKMMALLDDIDFLKKSLKYYAKKLHKIEIYIEKFHDIHSFSMSDEYQKKVDNIYGRKNIFDKSIIMFTDLLNKKEEEYNKLLEFDYKSS